MNATKTLVVAMSMLIAGTTASAKTGNPVSDLKFGGVKNDMQLFRLNLNNTEARKLTIVIRDANGNIFYKESLNGTALTRTFGIENELLADQDLWVEIQPEKTGNTEVYELKRVERSTPETQISKIQ